MIVIDAVNEHPCDKVWVWLSVDKDGNEGIVLAPVPGLGNVPLVCMHERNKGPMNTMAKQVAVLTKTMVRRVCFTRAEAEEMFWP
jgi:hypothetical protein